MAEINVTVALDDDGNVVQVRPGVVSLTSGDTVTYTLASKDETPWVFEGYYQPTQYLASRGDGSGSAPSVEFELNGSITAPDPGTTLDLTLMYAVTINGTGLNGQPLARTYAKSVDPIIVFH